LTLPRPDRMPVRGRIIAPLVAAERRISVHVRAPRSGSSVNATALGRWLAGSRWATSAASRTEATSAQDEPGPERVAQVEHEAVLAGPEGGRGHLRRQAVGDLSDRPGIERRAAIESLRQLSSMPISPSASSNAVRAEVADPVGERSTSPSAKMATPVNRLPEPTRAAESGARRPLLRRRLPYPNAGQHDLITSAPPASELVRETPATHRSSCARSPRTGPMSASPTSACHPATPTTVSAPRARSGNAFRAQRSSCVRNTWRLLGKVTPTACVRSGGTSAPLLIVIDGAFL
jgi:hypothetical protein